MSSRKLFSRHRLFQFCAAATALFAAASVSAQSSDYVLPDSRLLGAPKCVQSKDRSTACSESERAAWLKDVKAWREQRYLYIGYSDDRYNDPRTAWARDSFIQTQVGVEDRYLYDPATRRYTVDRYLDDVTKRYGGLDSVLLWPYYPNSGIDARNHMDMIRSMPGGIPAVRQMVSDFHRRGVRVLFPTMMWDQGTRKPDKSWPDEIAAVMKEVGADGVNGDTQRGVPLAFSLAADRINYSLVFEPEAPFDDNLLSHNMMSWGYYQRFFDFAPRVDRFKWLEPRHLVHVNERWAHDKTDHLHYAFFNGVGFETWENIWGIWNGLTPRDSELVRRVATLSRAMAPFLHSKEWEPYFPMEQMGIFASLWPKDGQSVWTIVNRNTHEVTGAQLSVPAEAGKRYFDLYHGTELTPVRRDRTDVLSFDLEPLGIGAIFATSSAPPSADVNALMTTMRGLSATPLASYDDRWKPLPQTMLPIAPTKAYASTPSGMVEIPAGDFNFVVKGVEIEEDKGYVDFQYFGEDSPRRFHNRKMTLGRYFIDRVPVSNKDFKGFLDAAAYKPQDNGGFLKDWKNGTYPSGWADKPVTWVSIEDARAFCGWAGKRLTHEWEWQYAAQGPDGRAYPWGNDWRADAVPVPDKSRTPRGPDDSTTHPAGASPFGVMDLVGNVWQWTDEYRDDHTRAAVLRGGSLYQPQTSSWYFPQAYRNDQHGKLLLMAPSKDRSAMIGFRCTADAEPVS